MEKSREIKEAFERAGEIVRRKPSAGQISKKATARVVEGLACEVREDQWVFASDEPEALGGAGSAPTPGVFSRMGLGACLATGYAICFAREEIPYSAIEVDVAGDMDQRCMLGIDESLPAGHPELRIAVRVTSPAPRAEIERVLAMAERRSPGLYWAAHPISYRRELDLTVPGEAAAPSTA